MKNTKRTLTAKITNNGIIYGYCEKTYIPKENTNTYYWKKTNYKTLSHTDRPSTVNQGGLVDLYADYYAFKYVHQALKTIYARSQQPYIYELLMSLYAENRNKWYISTDKQVAHNERYNYKKQHTKKAVNINGHKHMIETLPYYTVEKTETGKEIDNIFNEIEKTEKQNKFSRDEIKDLLQEARMAVVELVAYGMVNSKNDIELNREYIYKKLNSYILKQRQKTDELSSNNNNDNDNENYTADKKSYDEWITTVDRNDIIINVKEQISKKLKNDKALIIFEEYFMSGISQQQVAENLSLSVSNVQYWIRKIVEIAKNTI